MPLWRCRWLYQATNDETHWQASSLLANGRLGQGRLKVIEWRTRDHASKSEHPFDVVRQFMLTFVH